MSRSIRPLLPSIVEGPRPQHPLGGRRATVPIAVVILIIVLACLGWAEPQISELLAVLLPTGAVLAVSFHDYYRDNKERLILAVNRRIGDRATAEDVVQDAFATAYPQWSKIENPGGWLANACRWGASDVQRRNIRHPQKLLTAEEVERIPETTLSPDSVAVLRDDVHSATAQLHPEELAVFSRIAEGQSYAQVAALTGTSGTRVSAVVRAARTRLSEPQTATSGFAADLIAEIARLSPKQRTVFALACCGLRPAQIALFIGIDGNCARVHLHEAKKAVSASLVDRHPDTPGLIAQATQRRPVFHSAATISGDRLLSQVIGWLAQPRRRHASVGLLGVEITDANAVYLLFALLESHVLLDTSPAKFFIALLHWSNAAQAGLDDVEVFLLVKALEPWSPGLWRNKSDLAIWRRLESVRNTVFHEWHPGHSETSTVPAPATVITVNHDYVVVQTDDGRLGVLHGADVQYASVIREMWRRFAVGDRLEGAFLVDPQRGTARYTLLAGQINPWPVLAVRFPAGTRFHGTVVRVVNKIGLLVRIDGDVNGLIQQEALQQPAPSIGDQVEVLITSMNVVTRQVSLRLLNTAHAQVDLPARRLKPLPEPGHRPTPPSSALAPLPPTPVAKPTAVGPIVLPDGSTLPPLNDVVIPAS